jgi:hypothetical protein
MVDAEDERSSFRNRARRRKQSAVAAEHQSQIGRPHGQLGPWHYVGCRKISGAFVVHHHRVVALLQPSFERRQRFPKFGTIRLRNDGHGFLAGWARCGFAHVFQSAFGKSVLGKSVLGRLVFGVSPNVKLPIVPNHSMGGVENSA